LLDTLSLVVALTVVVVSTIKVWLWATR